MTNDSGIAAKSEDLGAVAAMLKGMVGEEVPVGCGGGKYWLASVLSDPIQLETKKTVSKVHKFNKGEWVVEIRWLECQDEEHRLYLDGKKDLVRVESIVWLPSFPDEALELEWIEIEDRGKGKKKTDAPKMSLAAKRRCASHKL